MRAKTNVRFFDREVMASRESGETFECSEDRYAQLLELGLIEAIEEVVVLPTVAPPSELDSKEQKPDDSKELDKGSEGIADPNQASMPSLVEEKPVPDKTWGFEQLKDYAAELGIDLAGLNSKDKLREAILKDLAAKTK